MAKFRATLDEITVRMAKLLVSGDMNNFGGTMGYQKKQKVGGAKTILKNIWKSMGRSIPTNYGK